MKKIIFQEKRIGRICMRLERKIPLKHILLQLIRLYCSLLLLPCYDDDDYWNWGNCSFNYLLIMFFNYVQFAFGNIGSHRHQTLGWVYSSQVIQKFKHKESLWFIDKRSKKSIMDWFLYFLWINDVFVFHASKWREFACKNS